MLIGYESAKHSLGLSCRPWGFQRPCPARRGGMHPQECKPILSGSTRPTLRSGMNIAIAIIVPAP